MSLKLESGQSKPMPMYASLLRLVYFHSSNILLQYLQSTLATALHGHIFLLLFNNHCIPLWLKNVSHLLKSFN